MASTIHCWIARVSRRMWLLCRRQSWPPSLTLATRRADRKIPPPESPKQTWLGIDQSAHVSSITLRTAESLIRRLPSQGHALAGVFGELAAKFQLLVDALNEVSEMAYTHTDRDILRLYEIWLKTGSRRAQALLRKLGVEPALSAHTTFRH